MHRPIHRWLAAVLAVLFLVPSAVPVSAATLVTSAVEGFESANPSWEVASGPATVSTVTSPVNVGSRALRIDYDFAGGSQVRLAPKATLPDLGGLPRWISVRVHGDASWNVMFLQLRDATGEIFHFKLGNVSFSGWKAMAFEPGRATPASTVGGDADRVLDLPIQVHRVVLDRNAGGLKSRSTIVIDHITSDSERWSPLKVDTKIFVPSAGQRTTLRVGLGETGTVSVVLKDEGGRTRAFSGSATGGATPLAFPWDGRDSGGTIMTGSVRGALTVTRSGTTWRYDVPYLAGLPVRAEAASPGSIAGINSTLTTINPDTRSKAESHARLMESAYLRMARESFDWNRLEPAKGQFEWAVFDQAVEVARAHNVSILGRLEFTAGWASSAPSSAPAGDRQFYPPQNMADFADYARAVVRRYKDRVKVWEIWNEENSAIFWKPTPSASKYASMLKAAYAAIKAEDPTATVVLGGLVGFDKPFLDGLVAAGAWSSFDALAIHTYVAPQPETSMIVSWLNNARAYVAKKGAKPIWVTEFGWSTYAGSGTSYIGVSEAKQAEYTARAYLHMAAAGVRGVFAYNLVELGTSTTSRLHNYGMVDGAGRQKPVYAAVRRVAEALDGATAAGVADPNAATRVTVDKLDTTGGWKAAPLGGGSASIATSTTRHGGTGSMKLTYAFTSSSTGVELSRNMVVSGSPTMVSVWVAGDGSANPVYLKVADRTGETFQAAIGALTSGWQRMTLYMDGSDVNWKKSGGDGDGLVDFPLTVKSLFVYRGGIGTLSGSAYFDDLQVETGRRVRGVVLSRRGAISQSLYTLGPAGTVSVPLTGTSAWRIDGPNKTALTVAGGKVSASVGLLPVNIVCLTDAAPSPFTPNGDGVADSSAIRWPSGDRTIYTLQVLSSSSKVLRTVTSKSAADAGIARGVWDGKINGSKAPNGTYRLRLTVHGPDGRMSTLLRDVVVQ